jgi:hypothetical protein
VNDLLRVRVYLTVVVVGLVVSGLTAFPLETETRALAALLHADWAPAPDALVRWIDRVRDGVAATNRNYPFMAYGTDWLAFAHLCIAVAFWGPLRDPVRNVWVVQFGMICCAGIIPLALIAGGVRGIPLWWQAIDASFAVFAVIPLLLAYRGMRRLEGAALTSAVT